MWRIWYKNDFDIFYKFVVKGTHDVKVHPQVSVPKALQLYQFKCILLYQIYIKNHVYIGMKFIKGISECTPTDFEHTWRQINFWYLYTKTHMFRAKVTAINAINVLCVRHIFRLLSSLKKSLNFTFNF
jgi:hypothetical protein